MKLTKNQLHTIVSTICNNELQKIRDKIAAKRDSKEVRELVAIADKEFSQISSTSWRLFHWKYCPQTVWKPPLKVFEDGAMRELWYNENEYLPSWFEEQIELKVQMCFIDAKDLKDLEKKVWYKFVIV